jgi:hypothetical protein
MLLKLNRIFPFDPDESGRSHGKIQKFSITYLSGHFLVRKLTSILLLACLCCTWVGYHFVFHVQLSAIKSEMKAFLQNEKNHANAVQISLTMEQCRQLEWENENEFEYKEVMYDLIEKKVSGGQVLLRCIADSKETALLQEFQKNTSRSRSHSLISQLITASFILPHQHLLDRPERTVKNKHTELSAFLAKAYTTVVSPPPDVC